jgi:hypothetical protein
MRRRRRSTPASLLRTFPSHPHLPSDECVFFAWWFIPCRAPAVCFRRGRLVLWMCGWAAVWCVCRRRAVGCVCAVCILPRGRCGVPVSIAWWCCRMALRGLRRRRRPPRPRRARFGCPWLVGVPSRPWPCRGWGLAQGPPGWWCAWTPSPRRCCPWPCIGSCCIVMWTWDAVWRSRVDGLRFVGTGCLARRFLLVCGAFFAPNG